MRVSERQVFAESRKTRLQILIEEIDKNHSDETMLLLVGRVKNILITRLAASVESVSPAKDDRVLIDKILSEIDNLELTTVEALQALTSWEQNVLKYMLRYERHGNYETPAGWENDE